MTDRHPAWSYSGSPLWSGLSTQRKVITALFIREMLTRFGRHNIGFLWLLVEPMLFTLGVTTLWYIADANHGSTLPIVAFALTGYSSVLLWRNMPSRCVGAIEPNQSLLYHRQVKLMDIYTARILLEAAGATMSFMILSIAYIALEWITPPEDVLLVVFAWLMLAWFGGALALLIGTIAFFSDPVEKLWHPLSYILLPLSGAAYLLDAMPAEAQKWLLYLPMVHGIEMLRDGYFGSKVNSIYDASYMALVSFVMTFLGLLMLRLVSRRVIPA